MQVSNQIILTMMVEALISKREGYRLQIRKNRLHASLKKQRQQTIAKLQNITFADNVPEGRFKTLALELISSRHRLNDIVQMLTPYSQDEDYAWCMLVCVKKALVSDPQILERLLQNIDRLLNENNHKRIVKMGLECYLSIIIDHPKLIAFFQNKKSLIDFYYRGKELQPLVTKVLMAYLSFSSICFHQSLISENYFAALQDILRHSKERDSVVELMTGLFYSDMQFVELYLPVFDTLMQIAQLHPSSAIFLLWRAILVSTSGNFADWMMQKSFAKTSVGILREPEIDKQVIVPILECVESLFRYSNARMVNSANTITPQQAFGEEGFQQILRRMEQEKEVYSQLSSELLNEYYGSSDVYVQQ